jgi:glycosyltransferase involved in cell wall biosynthesis
MNVCVYVPNLSPRKTGGAETYIRNLLKEFERSEKENTYDLVLAGANSAAFRELGQNFSFRVLSTLVNRFLNAAELVGMSPLRRAGTAVHRRLALFEDADLAFFPLQTLPYYLKFKVPTVVTAHDIQQEFFPENFARLHRRYRRFSHRPSLEAATRIISVSHFTKQTLMERYGIPPEKITVIHLGWDERFAQADAEAEERVRRRYRLPDTFLFYPAATWPHKNHLNLLRAARILRDRHGVRENLVFTSFPHKKHDAIAREIRKLGLSDGVRFLGFIPEEDLPALYRLATLLVFPSLFEGFGIPPLEAMASGLPVVCSRAASLPEVAGEAALYFDPFSPVDMAEKIHAALVSETLRRELVERGLQRASLFNWAKTARETLSVFEETVRQRG